MATVHILMYTSLDMGKAGSSGTNGWAIPKFTVKFKESSKIISNANSKKMHLIEMSCGGNLKCLNITKYGSVTTDQDGLYSGGLLTPYSEVGTGGWGHNMY